MYPTTAIVEMKTTYPIMQTAETASHFAVLASLFSASSLFFEGDDPAPVFSPSLEVEDNATESIFIERKTSRRKYKETRSCPSENRPARTRSNFGILRNVT